MKIRTRLIELLTLLSFLFISAQALAVNTAVVSHPHQHLRKTHRSGAEVEIFTHNATGRVSIQENIFFAKLSIKAGGKVPLHKDFENEYLYFLKGSGTISIDKKTFQVKTGSFVFMPKNAQVSFLAKTDVEVFQVFDPKGPEKKYEKWKVISK